MRLARNLFIVVALAAVLWIGTASVSKAQGSSLGRLAYVQQGDIWVKELPDGTPRQLTTDKQNRSPRIAPSGKWIAFYKSNVAWVMDSAGGQAQAIDGCLNNWAPTADVLTCFGIERVIGLRRAPNFAPENFAQPLEVGENAQLRHSKWAVGEAKLVSVYADGAHATFWALDAETGAQDKVGETTKPAEDEILVAAVPTLDHILYWDVPFGSGSIQADGVALYAVQATGTSQKLVSVVLTYSDWFAVSPDNRQLAVIAGNYRGAWTSKELQVVDLETNTAETLTDKSVAASSPAWTPDGRLIAYSQMPDKGDVVGGTDARVGLRMRRIWVTDANGGNAHAITQDEQYRDEYPQWSRDGQWILFTRFYQPSIQEAKQDQAAIWMMRSDGSGLQQIADITGANENAPYGEGEEWFGYYGHLSWFNYLDWWQPKDSSVLPSTGAGEKNLLPILVFGGVLLMLGGMVLMRRRKNAES